MAVFTEFSAVDVPLNNSTRKKENKNIKIVTRKGGNKITKDGIGKERINKHMHKPINNPLKLKNLRLIQGMCTAGNVVLAGISVTFFIDKIQQNATVCRYLFTASLLYMFRASIAPIIRSTKNCNRSLWYRS